MFLNWYFFCLGLINLFFLILIYTDLKYFYLPYSLIIINIVLALIYRNLTGNFLGAITSSTVAFLIMISIYLLTRLYYGYEVIGKGDILLVGMIGLLTDSYQLLKIIYLAFLFAGFLAIILLITKKAGYKSMIALGPFFITSYWLNSSLKLCY